MAHNLHKNAIAMVGLLFLINCSMYKMDIQQGANLSTTQIHNLEIGQTKAEVQDIAGTPTLVPIFNTKQWDYYYFLMSGSQGETMKSHYILKFDNNNKLTNIDKKY